MDVQPGCEDIQILWNKASSMSALHYRSEQDISDRNTQEWELFCVRHGHIQHRWTGFDQAEVTSHVLNSQGQSSSQEEQVQDQIRKGRRQWMAHHQDEEAIVMDGFIHIRGDKSRNDTGAITVYYIVAASSVLFAFAMCSPKDNFVKRIGRAKAKGRVQAGRMPFAGAVPFDRALPHKDGLPQQPAEWRRGQFIDWFMPALFVRIMENRAVPEWAKSIAHSDWQRRIRESENHG